MKDQKKYLEITTKDLKTTISTTIKKIAGQRENDICRYLPVEGGGYMHHFTLRKMKNEEPAELSRLIHKYILNVASPITVPPKPRAPRGTRKRKDQFNFSKSDWERMLNLARLAGDKEMVRKLTPKKDLRTLKRELIASSRHNNIDQELWNSYVEAVTSPSSFTNPQNSAELLSALTSTLYASATQSGALAATAMGSGSNS